LTIYAILPLLTLRHPPGCGSAEESTQNGCNFPDNKWLVGFVSQKLSLFDFGGSQNKPLIGFAL
jgi:hypothetical protein